MTAVFERIGRIEPNNAIILNLHEGRMSVYDGYAELVLGSAFQRPRP